MGCLLGRPLGARVITLAFASFASVSSLVVTACSDAPNVLVGGAPGIARTDTSTDGSSGAGSSTSGSSGSKGSSSGATSSSSSSGSPGDGSLAQLCVDTINEYRSSLGLPPYERWTAAESCSNGEAESDGKSGRAHGAFPGCDELAQNECPGWDGSSEQALKGCLRAMWGEGPGGGHYEQMKSREHTKVACGFYTTSRGALWSVQNFR